MNRTPSVGRRRFTRSLAALSAATVCQGLQAQQGAGTSSYPDHTIRWLVPLPPGGGADAVARLLAQAMSPALNGQSIQIENRPGAQTVIGTQALVNARPDGYTVASAIDSLPVNEHLMDKVPYKMTDVTPISIFVKSPLLLVSGPDLPGTTVADLARHLRAQGNKLSYSTWGAGSSSHLAMEAMSLQLGVTLNHVPFPGAAPALTALLGGHVQVMWAGLTTAAPHVKTGKLKAWAVSTKTRSTVLPDVAPLAEQGMADFDVFGWNGLIVPKSTPPDVVQRLSDAVKLALKSPEVRDALSAQGLVVWGSTPDEFRDQMRRDSQFAKQVIDSRGLRQ